MKKPSDSKGLRKPKTLGRGARALYASVKLELRSGRLVKRPHVAASKTYARVRRALRSTPQISQGDTSFPTAIDQHRLMPLVAIAGERPARLKELRQQLATRFWTDHVADELSVLLLELLRYPELNRETRNVFVAALAVLCEKSLHSGVRFGDRFIFRIPDPRALRSLVIFWQRAGNLQRALSYATLLEPDEWVIAKRTALEKRIAALMSETSPADHLQHYWGYKHLGRDPEAAVLLYGDIDLNVIDGSSVWLASVAEALSGSGLQVHFLLKTNVERALLLEPLLNREDVEVIEPRFAGYERLTAERAITVIEAMDGIVGGYRAIIVRGMDVANLAASCRSLWKRTWAYLTDFYQIDGMDGGSIVLASESTERFIDFREAFAHFLVQTPQIANVMREEFGIADDMVLRLPPMIPDGTICGTGSTRQAKDPWRIAYAGKIAPQWGVLELLETAEKLHALGHGIEVHLIGDKIHANSEQNPTFEEDIQAAIERSKVVTWHRGLARAQVLDLMREMDLAWCYRDPRLERHTLELSTKLLECIAIQVPMILTRNAINEQLLGTEYSLFVDQPDELFELLQNVMKGTQLPSLASDHHLRIVGAHRISSVRVEHLGPALQTSKRLASSKRIVLAGHDLKFIAEFESHLKKQGHMVRRDTWEWGKPQDLGRTRHLADWSDIVFCEWALANAVWYSKNLDPAKRLVVRLHSQEIHKRGKVFPPRLVMENINQVVFVSNHMRQDAVELFNWSEVKLTTVPNFVRCEAFARDKDPTAAFRIGLVGCVPEMKRLDRALDFIAKLRKQDPRFTLVVKGKLPKDYPWMAARSDEMGYYDAQFHRIESEPTLKDGVVFEEFSPRLSSWYQGIGSVLSPSEFESFHYAVAEGAASGAVPIIWPWNGATEMFPRDWVVADTDAAVDQALSVLGDSWEPRAMTATRRAIQDRYDAPVIFSKLENVVTGATF